MQNDKKQDAEQYMYHCKQRQTHEHREWLPRWRGLGEGWIVSLGLADANYYI